MAQVIRKRVRLTAHSEQVVAIPRCGPVEHVSPEVLIHENRHLRRRKDAENRRHGECMEASGIYLPILATRDGKILYGHDTLAAYMLLRTETVPVIYVDNRPAAEVKAAQLWLEAFHAAGRWDELLQKDHIEEILESAPDLIASTFLEPSEIDFLLFGPAGSAGGDDAIEGPEGERPAPVTRPGDVFEWPQGHKAICGNSRMPETLALLMGDKKARLLATDPPYGTTVKAISSRHEEWIEGSGMSETETTSFLEQSFGAAVPHLIDGALIYAFIDQKGMHPLLSAFRSNGFEQKNICVWDKGSGLGGMYMNAAEFVVIAKQGKAKHVFNRKNGFPTTVWSVPGYAQFRPDREVALEDHACTKPLGVLMPILLAASKRNEICLDLFMGSGTFMRAAQRTGRLCYGVEIDPHFVDTTIRRMHELTGEYPVHQPSGLRFDLLATERGVSLTTPATAGVAQ